MFTSHITSARVNLRVCCTCILAAGALMCSPNQGEEQKPPDESDGGECRCARIDDDGSGLFIELDCFCDWFECPSESDLSSRAEQGYWGIGVCDGITSYGPIGEVLGGSVFSYRDGELIGAQVFEDVDIYCGEWQVRAGIAGCPIPESENDNESADPCQDSGPGGVGGGGCLLLR